GESLAEIEIPFIIWGKSVKKNYKLTYPVYQYDNAATVAFALGLKIPIAWIGKPVKNALMGFSETDEYPLIERLKEPMILPKASLNKKAGGLFDEQTEIIIENPNNAGTVFYTIDGTKPSKDSKTYNAPFNTNKNTVVKSAIFMDGKIRSAVSEAYFRVKPKNLVAPVTYELFYLDNLSEIPSLENRKPDSMGHCFEITSDEVKEEIKSNTTVRFKTQIVIEKEGEYTFYTRSDDGSKLWVNNVEVVDNDGDHGVKEKAGKILLKPGKYPLEVIWFNGGGGSWLDVFYQSAGIPKQIVPTTVLELK
ncbi:MAG: PA14 domain-containing protein, partial [Lutibacter sp.]|nr:PA14 domain-containing protein [Lutibacter sp.]